MVDIMVTFRWLRIGFDITPESADLASGIV